MKYIDLKTKYHTLEEHMMIVDGLLEQGYKYVGNSFGNPKFFHPTDKTKEDVCILSSVVTQDGYFAIE